MSPAHLDKGLHLGLVRAVHGAGGAALAVRREVLLGHEEGERAWLPLLAHVGGGFVHLEIITD